MLRKKVENNSATFNIQSYIRVRPLEPSEKKSTHFSFSKKDVVIKGASGFSKTLTFDRVFDEDVKQAVVYSNVVKPMIKEVLEGYNCTVFAYGQTGTGKTHTMSGEFDGTLPRDCPQAGIIPRALEEIFGELAILNQEHVVTITFIELYNEKLVSLISDESDIGLVEGADGNVIFKNLNPVPVNTISEAMKLLQLGNEKRTTASTNINATSSRSHSIFTITVKIKEPKIDSEELRTAKLHLVDLAGSENVNRSGTLQASKTDKLWTQTPGFGSSNPRLKESININTSLLVLRRVIICLTENNSHIPYRESKLTRLLMDSLGGKTKTCIIGTISPSQLNQDESESTLNYAVKARSIKNKPVKNTTESKKEFLQVATEEIARLKRDLEANRQADGFFISHESYEEMTTRMKQLGDQVKSWSERYSDLNKSYDQKMALYDEVYCDLTDTKVELEQAENMIRFERKKIEQLIREKRLHVELREYLIQQYTNSGKQLTDEAVKCKSVAETLYEQSQLLHDKIDRKSDIERKNMAMMDEVKQTISDKADELKAVINSSHESQKNILEGVMAKSSINLETLCSCHNAMKQILSQAQENFTKNCLKIEDVCELTNNNKIPQFREALSQLKKSVEESCNAKIALERDLVAKMSEAVDLSAELQKNITEFKNLNDGYKKLHQTQVLHFNNFKDLVCEKLSDAIAFAEKNIKQNTTSVVDETSKIKNKLLAITTMLHEVTLDNNKLLKNAESSMGDFRETVNKVVDLKEYVSSVTNDECDEMLNQSRIHTDEVVQEFDLFKHKLRDCTRSSEEERKNVILVLAAASITDKLSIENVVQDQLHLDNIAGAIEPIGENVKILRKTMKSDVKTLLDKIDESDRNSEVTMRMQNDSLSSALAVNNTLEESSKGLISKLEESTNGGRHFIRDSPTGLTPVRISAKNELRYPSCFHTLPNYERLISNFSTTRTPEEQADLIDIGNITKFKQIENTKSLQDVRSINSSEYVTTHMEASCNQDISDKTDSSYATASSNNCKLRRSLSLSSVVDMSTLEDKENKFTPGLEGGIAKSKLKERKTFKRMNILGVSPNMIKVNKK